MSTSNLSVTYNLILEAVNKVSKRVDNGAFYTKKGMSNFVLGYDTRISHLNQDDEETFRALFQSAFTEFKKEKIKLSVKSSDGFTMQVKYFKYIPLTTRGGSIENPTYAYINLPFLKKEDFEGAITIKTRNLVRAKNSLEILQLITKGRF